MRTVKTLVIEINRLSKVEGGGYDASIPSLGKLAYHGWGNTMKEALRHLFEVGIDLIDLEKKGVNNEKSTKSAHKSKRI